MFSLFKGDLGINTAYSEAKKQRVRMEQTSEALRPVVDLCSHLESKSTSDRSIFEAISRLTPLPSDIARHLLNGPNDFVHQQTLQRVVFGLYRFCSVPSFKGREDIGYKRSDFTDLPSKAERTFPFLCSFLTQVHKVVQDKPNTKKPFIQEIIKRVLLMCSEHVRPNLWTTKLSQNAAGELLQTTLVVTSCNKVDELLCDPSHESLIAKGMAGALLEELIPNLQKGVWKTHPSSMASFDWIISEIHFPHMGSLLPLILPPCLLLNDDHEPANKASGIISLHHIIKEVTCEELRRHGRAEVIYDAVQHALYSRETEVLAAALPTIVSILAVVETPPAKMPLPLSETRYDTILERLLQSMELESLLVLRRLYAHHLPSIISHMGLSICRHLSRLLAVIDSYIQAADGPTEEARLAALTILSVVITEAWPRIPRHIDSILRTIFRLVHDLSNNKSAPTRESSDTHQSLIMEGTKCVRLLYAIDKHHVYTELTAVINTPVHISCRQFAENILQDPT